jgi:type IV secretion system protein TrbH
MNRLVITFFFLSSLSGCATVRNEHFTTAVPAELGNSLAADAIKQLQTLYPPAHTKFNIDQPVPKTDSFGTSLVFQLREKGYAVQIIDPTQPAQGLAGISTHYTVDQPASSLFAGLYRVQLTVGKAILTRAYTAGNNMAIPAGAWAKME